MCKYELNVLYFIARIQVKGEDVDVSCFKFLLQEKCLKPCMDFLSFQLADNSFWRKRKTQCLKFLVFEQGLFVAIVEHQVTKGAKV